MSSELIQQDLDSWLQKATAGLPEPHATITRTELYNHYLDAVEFHCGNGLSETEAHLVALGELGNAELTARSLKAVHFSRPRSLAGLLACLAYPAILFGSQALIPSIGFLPANILLVLSSSLIILYVLYSLKFLLQPFNSAIEAPIHLMAAGQVLWAGIALVDFIAFSRLPLMDSIGNIFWDFSTPATGIINSIMLLGEFISGLGALWLSYRLLCQANKLLKALSLLMLLVGVSSMGLCFSLILAWNNLVYLFSALGYTVVTATMCLMAYVFYSVFVRGFSFPLRHA